MKSMVKEVVHQLAFSILDADKIPGFEGRKPINVRSSWGFVAGLWYF
jgi:hypothetical protein